MAYFQPFVEPTKPRMRFKAQGEIDALEFSMITFATHTNFAGVLEDNNRLNNDRLFAIFQAWTNAITARSGTDWQQSHCFTDPWKHPYIFLLEPVAGKSSAVHRLKVRSIGPNGRDEDGKGDDITGRGVLLEPE
jgi:hypothetical protein